ncbi:MAG: Mur ligase family protein [Dehalococcoidia bacterium]
MQLWFIPAFIVVAAGAASTIPKAIIPAVAFAFVGLGLSLAALQEPAAKKPLVMTARVKRLFIALAIVIGIVAIVALLAGWALGAPGRVRLALAPFFVWLVVAFGPVLAVAANLLVMPVERANRRRYRNEAAARLRTVAPRIVAITGSYGKTTTKELVAAVLETKYRDRMQRTPKSFNTVMGITRVIREELRDDCEVFVVEMGAYQRGDIRDLCRFVGGPDISALVGINEQHLERMGSIENTMRAKYEIVEETKPGGVTVLNIDNAHVEKLANQTERVRVIRVGACPHAPPADLTAGNVSVTPKLMKFDVIDGDQTYTVRTRMLGRHLLPNFLIALAIGKELGVDLRQAVTRLGRVEPVDHRLAVSESDGMTVIDDAYSSNVDGARAAIDLLAELPAQHRFVVTPGIVELGAVEAERNRELGAHVARRCDTLIVVGQTPGRFVREGALAAGMPAECVVSVASLPEAQAHLRGQMRPGDAVLFENDLPDNYA